MKKLTKDLILVALRRIGELAQQQNIELELAIYGGCAMILAFDRYYPDDTPSESAIAMIAQIIKEETKP